MKPKRELLDELARLRLTAEQYALGAHRRDKSIWAAVLANDCVIAGPGFSIVGREANLASIDTLAQMFRRTSHKVHQVSATISGDDARGETISTADHLLIDRDCILSWSIRYQDEWRREDGVWRFAQRRLVLDWEETRPVTTAGEIR